ncbi:MAG: acyloxyacyl hydrolase [Pseudomonadota bacterium]
MRLYLLLTLVCFGLPVAMAEAQSGENKTTFSDIVSEVRFGVLAHNIPIGGSADAENQEEGENIQVEILFHTPKRLRWKYFFDPEPYIVGSWNTAGNTSFGGFGLSWDWQLGKRKRWEIETSLGYIVHSGEIDIPFPEDPGNPANAAFDNNNILFGSRDLFRSTLALNRHLGERWGVQLIYEHLSHGQIIGDGRNQGNDSVGGRVYYRFGRVD